MEVEKQMQEISAIDNYPEEKVAVAIDVDDDDVPCLKSMKKKLEAVGMCGESSLPPFTICRVPPVIRQGDDGAYDPKIISLGPYHHGKPGLQAMEEHKWRYLGTLIARHPKTNLEDYIAEMEVLEPWSRSSYAGSVVAMGSDRFVEMMVLDGCFIIEILLKRQQKSGTEAGSYPPDPIYSESWVLPLIAQDMLLLENQLPFFALERLFAQFGDPSSLPELVLDFFEHILPKNKNLPPTKNILHLLHLLHTRLLPESQAEKVFARLDHKSSPCKIARRSMILLDNKPPKRPKRLPPAEALHDAGVKFWLKEGAGSFLEVEFKGGRMEMPVISIYDSTNSLLRNLIALEQCFPDCGNHLTSYAIFMDSMVNSEKDVAILSDAKIVDHVFGSDEDVAQLFNHLCRGISTDFEDSYLRGLFEDVIGYSDTRWHRWKAHLMRDYFGNPWSILSLTAAVIVLFLTLVQTYFAIYAYFTPP